jgi:protein phosphatase
MKFRISQPQAIHQLGSRQNQEDTIFPVLNNATSADRLFILCDGMGGHESGEIASGTVCKTMSDYILSHLPQDGVLEDALFEEALDAAYAAVNAQDSTGQKKMGTTLTFLCFHKGGCTAAHIGDSRIYHLRPSTNEILYRSRDHSLIYDLFEIGELTYDEMKTAKNKNVITRVIMANQERPSKADIVHITNIEPGDYFYMCSDGMLEQMDDDDLLEIFRSDKTDEEKRKILTGETIDNSDNHSAYIIHIESVEREQGDNMLPNDEDSARAANKVLLYERDPQARASAEMMPPPPPPVQQPTDYEQQTYDDQQADDDIQVVVGEPVHPQPSNFNPPPSNYNPPTKQGGNSMLKWGIIGFLLVAVIVAAGVLLYILLGGDSKPTPQQSEPQEITLPSKPTKPEVRDNDDDYMYPSSNRPTRTTTTTTTTSRPTTATSGRTTTNNNSLSGTVNGLRNQKPDKDNDNKPQDVKPTTTTTPARSGGPKDNGTPDRPSVNFEEE